MVDIRAFNEGQHAPRQGRCCLSQLLTHEKIIQAIKNGRNVDIIYLDFAKAFHKVDHGILFHKVKALGIGSKLGEQLHSFLSNRDNECQMRAVLSMEFPMPQS